MKDKCGVCHGASQSPLFAVGEASAAYQTISEAKMIDYSNAENSRFIEKLKTNHNCGGAEECSAFSNTLLNAFKKMIELKNVVKQEIKNASPEVKLSSAELKIHDVAPKSYQVFEAEKFADDSFDSGKADSDTIFVKSKVGAMGAISAYADLDGFNSFYLWVRYRLTGTADISVKINNVDMDPFGDKLVPTAGNWIWKAYNTADNLIDLGGVTSLIFSPSAPDIEIDKFVIVPFEVNFPKLTRKVIAVDLKDLLGVDAKMYLVAESDDEKGYYRVGQPVIETDVPVKIQKMKIYFNGEVKSNETTFDLINKVATPGRTILSQGMQAIPFPESGKKDSDTITLSFEEISLVE